MEIYHFIHSNVNRERSFILAATVGHGWNGEGGQHHLVLLQVRRGGHSRLCPRQPRLLQHPVTASPGHCDVCRERENIPLWQQV